MCIVMGNTANYKFFCFNQFKLFLCLLKQRSDDLIVENNFLSILFIPLD